MAESKEDKTTPSFADAVVKAKEAKAARKAQAKKDRAATGGGTGGTKGFKPQQGGPQGHAQTKAFTPRMPTPQKKGGG